MAADQISSIDWQKCFLCQSRKNENLRSQLKTQEKLAFNLRKFFDLHELDYHLNWVGSVVDIKQILNENKAQYHHSCSTKYNDNMLKRAQERSEKTLPEKRFECL